MILFMLWGLSVFPAAHIAYMELMEAKNTGCYEGKALVILLAYTAYSHISLFVAWGMRRGWIQ